MRYTAYGVEFNPLGIKIPVDLDLLESRDEGGRTVTANRAFWKMISIARQRGLPFEPIPGRVQEEAWREAEKERDDAFIHQETILARVNARRRFRREPQISWCTHR